MSKLTTYVQDNQGPTIQKLQMVPEEGAIVAHFDMPAEMGRLYEPCIWDERQCKWRAHASAAGVRALARNARTSIILLRRADVTELVGLGSMLETLENLRAIQNVLNMTQADARGES